MVRFLGLLERLNLRLSNEKASSLAKRNSLYNRNTDTWSALETAIQRGLPDDIVAWRREHVSKKDPLNDSADDGWKEGVGLEGMERVGEDSVDGMADQPSIQDQMNITRYIRRSCEFAGRVCVTPLQLAVMERKVEVVLALLVGLSTDELHAAINTKLNVVEKEDAVSPSKKTPRFSVSIITTSFSVESAAVDWTDPMEWTALHLAVKYDVECLKVLLYLLENQVDSLIVEEVLEARDSKGRGLLHLAARCPTSSTPTRLLLDLGAQADSKDDFGLTPVHVAVKYGTLDTVRVLLDHGGFNQSSLETLDQGSRGLLRFSSDTNITRYLMRRGLKPDLNTLEYQTSHLGTENVLVFLDSMLELQGDLLILDLSLAMEQDRDGDLGTDGESVFLRNLISHRKLLQSPLPESLLCMKWYACRRVILLDLLFYFIFISCLTGVICYSTSPQRSPVLDALSNPESALVDLVINNFRPELERRGWKLLPRSTSTFDAILHDIPPDLPSPLVSSPTTASDAGVGIEGVGAGVADVGARITKFPLSFGFYLFTVVLSAMFLLRETVEFLAQGPTQYFNSVENIFEIFIIFLTILCQIYLPDYSDNVYLYEILQVLTVFFGWLGLTCHFAKLPNIGIYIYLAVKVFRQLVLSLLVFTTILLAFAFSFHLALREHKVFDNAFTSFLKIVNMMVGEYNFDYNFTFESVREVGGSNGMVQLLLISFILLVSITIQNLIIAIVIANINKLMDEADYYQLGRTVDLLSTVHNVKQTLIRFIPCLKKVFAPTLHDYVGGQTKLCVNVTEVDPSLSWLVRLQNAFRSSSRFYPVYKYNRKTKEQGEQTGLVLEERIISAAIHICRQRDNNRHESGISVRGQDGRTEDYRSDWRDQVGDESIIPLPSFQPLKQKK